MMFSEREWQCNASGGLTRNKNPVHATPHASHTIQNLASCANVCAHIHIYTYMHARMYMYKNIYGKRAFQYPPGEHLNVHLAWQGILGLVKA